jgi:hypothetical protein
MQVYMKYEVIRFNGIGLYSFFDQHCQHPFDVSIISKITKKNSKEQY